MVTINIIFCLLFIDDFQRSTERILTSCLEMESTIHQSLTTPEQYVVSAVKKHLHENPNFFDFTCEELNLTATNFQSGLMDICEGIFSDKEINWGRILTILCLFRALSVNSQKIGLPSSAVEYISPCATLFIDASLKNWIIAKGGWVS